jgi:hypothetical protein
MDIEEENIDAIISDAVESKIVQLVDSTIVFNTENLFVICGDLLKWAKNVGTKNGVVVMIYRFETATTKLGIPTP